MNTQDSLNTQLVFHEGDIVQNGSTNPSEWSIADAAIDVLDGANIPYLLAIGNHDYDDQANTRSSNTYNSNFGQSRYTGRSWWSGGFYEDSHSENSYLILNILGVDYLFMNLEYGPRDEVIQWADGILSSNLDKLCILVTHSYMYRDNTRTGVGDQYNPKLTLSDANDGEDLWNKLIKLHDNVIWIQSGHDITNGDGAARRVDLSNGGQLVNQILANYQDFSNGGDGFLRIVTFYPGDRVIQVQTYSPVLGKFLLDENSFLASY